MGVWRAKLTKQHEKGYFQNVVAHIGMDASI